MNLKWCQGSMFGFYASFRLRKYTYWVLFGHLRLFPRSYPLAIQNGWGQLLAHCIILVPEILILDGIWLFQAVFHEPEVAVLDSKLYLRWFLASERHSSWMFLEVTNMSIMVRRLSLFWKHMFLGNSRKLSNHTQYRKSPS